MKNISIYTMLFFIMLSMNACKKDIDILNQTEVGIPAAVESKGSLAGLVSDVNGNPIADVLVSVGGQTTTTNKDGAYILNDIWVNHNGTLVHFYKDGYYDGHKISNVTESTRTLINAVLAQRTVVGVFNSDLSDIPGFIPGTIIFQANSFVTSDGEPYNGLVSLFINYIDPTTSSGIDQMPGDLRAVDSENVVRVLNSYGMIDVELEGESGEKLNIDPNLPATIRVKVPESLLSSTRPSIPLWHFDTSNGYWIEEGSAELIDGFYVGQVNHFSTWNCDIPHPIVSLKGRAVYSDGSPASSVNLAISCTDIYFGINSTVGAYGHFQGFVPADQDVTIQFKFDQLCDEALYETTITTSTQAIDLGTVVISDDGKYNLLKVQLEDCQNNSLPSAYLSLSSDIQASRAFPDLSGQVTVPIPNCVSNFDMHGIDLIGNSISESISFPNGIDEDEDYGVLQICDSLNTFMDVNFDGENYYIDYCSLLAFEEGGSYNYFLRSQQAISGGGFDTTIIGSEEWLFLISFSKEGSLAEAGDTLAPWNAMMFPRLLFNINEKYGCNQDCENLTVTMTKTPNNLTGVFEGTFEGELIRETSGEIKQISGSFRAIQ